MLKLNNVNHIAVLCSDYQRSLRFYQDVLGCTLITEEIRDGGKFILTRLALNGVYTIELFAFNRYIQRPAEPETLGLRHLAFTVDSLEKAVEELDRLGIAHEPIRELPNLRILFFADPDGLPIELVEA